MRGDRTETLYNYSGSHTISDNGSFVVLVLEQVLCIVHPAPLKPLRDFRYVLTCVHHLLVDTRVLKGGVVEELLPKLVIPVNRPLPQVCVRFCVWEGS